MLCSGELSGFWAVCLLSLISTRTWYVGLRMVEQHCFTNLWTPHPLRAADSTIQRRFSTLQYFFTETWRAALQPFLYWRRSIIVDRLRSIIVKPTGSVCLSSWWRLGMFRENYTAVPHTTRVLTLNSLFGIQMEIAYHQDTENLWLHVCQSKGNYSYKL